MTDPPPRCENGHALYQFEVTGCDAGHEHREYVCPMRRGASRCGLVVVVPPRTDACSDDPQ